MAHRIDMIDMRTNRVGLRDVMIHYGDWEEMKFNPENGEVRGKCPFHDDEKPSFTANVFKKGFKCHGCGVSGNIFSYIVLKEGINEADERKNAYRASTYVDRWFPDWREWKIDEKRDNTVVIQNELQSTTEQVSDEEIINPPLRYDRLKLLNPNHLYLTETRGLSVATCEYFGVGFNENTRGFTAGLIAIPIHNENSELVAYTGRWPEKEIPEAEKKYKFPPGFKASHVVFNLHRLMANAFDYIDELIITEGFFDVMSLWQEGVTNVVALMGTSLSQVQENLLLRVIGKQGKVILAFDNDEAGHKGAEHCASRLCWHTTITAMPYQELITLSR